MKLAFSTVGCPDFTWPEMYTMAKDLGFKGIEVRGFGEEILNIYHSPFSKERLAETSAKLKKLRLQIPCISSGSSLQYKDTVEASKAEIVRYIDLAAELGTPYVRILADRTAAPCDPVDEELVTAAIRELLPHAEEKGVILLVETNGVFADTIRLSNLLRALASDSVGVLWDVHHTFRFGGETPAKTVENLGSYIRHVHFKDSLFEEGRVIYKMMGEGDLPVNEIIMALRSLNYSGYLTLEWVKNTVPDLESAAVVFPHYVNFMGEFLDLGDTASGKLYDNNSKTGKYVWPKNHLIDLTFSQVLDRMVEEFPEQCAFKYTTLDYTRTYTEFREDVDEFARTLISLGVKAGDHVAIWATNVPQWFITFWAATKIGAVLVTVNTAYKIHEAEYLLRQSDTHTLVMIEGFKDSDYSGIVQKLCPELAGKEKASPLFAKKLPFLRNVITCGFELPGCLTWEESLSLASKVSIETVHSRAAATGKHDVCNMQYTSGTTGFPKGVMLTHYNVVNDGKTIGDGMDLSTADRMMIQVPMFHCFGMVLAMTAAMTHGAAMSPIPAFSPSKGLACITQEKITCFHGVPTMFITMLSHPNFAKTDFSHMRTGIMAGSPCPIKVMEEVIEKMNMSEITIVYGQTESSPGCTMSKTTDSIEVRVNTVGSAFYGVECKIVDPETGKDMPDNEVGEFVARGYNIMKGYYKMPEATAAAIDADGWLHTGDLAKRDADGNYKITGRIKDMIIRGGENIYPKEIEDFIYTHPKVSDVQVIGVPSKAYGEEIMACIIPKKGESLTEQEVKDFVMESMAKHKVPSYVHFTDAFPMNAAGKILKYKMREDAVEKLSLQAESKIVTA
ncbi:MAG: AMP-binding protein [Oscillospiraceae bacterium]|nr:AMP-binding protein [Oscillospiraceae bacterium]